MSRLHWIQQLPPGTAVADIVFVHGLNGGPVDTWACSQDRRADSWPHWLAEELPAVNVSSLEYDATASAWLGDSMPLLDRGLNVLAMLAATGVGQLPTLFVAHSLGGLVVKQLLRHSRTSANERQRAMVDNTIGVVFLSTPHSGAPLASFLQNLGFVARASSVAKDLAKNSPVLRDLGTWYRKHAPENDIETLSLYETQKTRGVLVVDPASADPGIAGSVAVPVDSDHFDIAKPPDRQAEVYLQVRQFAEDKLAPLRAISRGESTRDWERIDRAEVLEAIEALLEANWPVINIFGGSGHGKSQVLFSLRRRLRGSEKFVDCLFPPLKNSSHEALGALISSRIGGESTDSAAAWPEPLTAFDKSGRRTVFMIDDAHELSEDILNRIVASLLQYPGASVVCSSRSDLTEENGPFSAFHAKSVRVPVFSLEEALQVLAPHFERLEDEGQTLILSHLDDEVARHPIAVRYIRQRISKGAGRDEASDAIQTALDGLDEAINREIASIFIKVNLEPEARFGLLAPRSLDSGTVGCVLSALNPSHVDPSRAAELLEGLFRSGFLKRFSSRFWWEGYYQSALERRGSPPTSAFDSLLEREQADRPFTAARAGDALHYLRYSSKTAVEEDEAAVQVLKFLAQDLPTDATIPSEPALQRYIDRLYESDEELTFLRARYLECAGKYNEALRAVEGLSASFGPSTAAIRFQLLDKLGQFDELKSQLREHAIQLTEGAEPDASWDAMTLYYWGRSEQATGSIGKALATYELIERTTDPDLVQRIHGLIQGATIFVFSEEPEDALDLLRRAEGLASGEVFLREQADIFRYRARVAKLLAVRNAASVRVNLVEALALTARAFKAAREINYQEGIIWATVLAARCHYFRGKLAAADEDFEKALLAAEVTEYRGATPHILRHRCLVAAVGGDFARAGDYLDQARSFAMDSGRRYLPALLFHTEAKVRALEGDLDQAIVAVGSALAHYEECGVLDPPFSRIKETLVRALEHPELLRENGRPW